jgi:hypothetical protein
MHPGWLVLAVSLWLGIACNVELWRMLAGTSSAKPLAAFTSSILIAAAAALVLSIFGWRRTLKGAATVLLFAGALIACGLWAQALPMDSLWTLPPRQLLPSWASLLRWQVPALWAALALPAALWVWQKSLRRLTGPQQLRSNVLGMVFAGAIVLAGGLLPWR